MFAWLKNLRRKRQEQTDEEEFYQAHRLKIRDMQKETLKLLDDKLLLLKNRRQVMLAEAALDEYDDDDGDDDDGDIPDNDPFSDPEGFFTKIAVQAIQKAFVGGNAQATGNGAVPPITPAPSLSQDEIRSFLRSMPKKDLKKFKALDPMEQRKAIKQIVPNLPDEECNRVITLADAEF